MRSISLVLLLLWAFVLPRADAQGMPAYMDTALSYVGTTEQAPNQGPAIDRFLSDVHLQPGNPYCAAFVSYSLDAAGNVLSPTVRSGLATNFITARSIPSRLVLRGTVSIPTGAILIFRKGQTIHGHTGFVIVWAKSEGITVEANTSPDRSGNQSDGGGVWIRHRAIQPANYFRITDFTPVRVKGRKFLKK